MTKTDIASVAKRATNRVGLMIMVQMHAPMTAPKFCSADFARKRDAADILISGDCMTFG